MIVQHPSSQLANMVAFNPSLQQKMVDISIEFGIGLNMNILDHVIAEHIINSLIVPDLQRSDTLATLGHQ